MLNQLGRRVAPESNDDFKDCEWVDGTERARESKRSVLAKFHLFLCALGWCILRHALPGQALNMWPNDVCSAARIGGRETASVALP